MLDRINVKYWELAHTKSELGYHRSSDYSAHCDVCGDSSKIKSKKRLHLYKKQSYDDDSIKCFNCGYTGNMFSYLKNYHPDLYASYRQEKGFNSLETLKGVNLEYKSEPKINSLYIFEAPKEFILNDPRAKDYLKTRQLEMDVYYSEGLITIDSKTINLSDYIIIPLLENNKWYGFYSRSIKTKTFHTYIPQQNTGYKVYNWTNISKKSTVYVFEAIFNMHSTNLPNCVASMGSDLPMERIQELDDIVFCFDNDKTGKEKSLKYSKLGHKVCILPKNIREKDFNDLLQNGWSKEDITALILDNIYSGISASVRLMMGS